MSRALWWASALAAISVAVWVGGSPMADVSMSCSKSDVLYVDGIRSDLRCDDSIVRVLGVGPVIGLGLLLTMPPVVAALAMRRWVSWLVVAVLMGLSVVGIVNWASYWRVLLFALPLAALGWIAVTVQSDPRLEPRRVRQ